MNIEIKPLDIFKALANQAGYNNIQELSTAIGYSVNHLSKKLSQGTITFNDCKKVAEATGTKFVFDFKKSDKD